jgi:hypothetical protein
MGFLARILRRNNILNPLIMKTLTFLAAFTIFLTSVNAQLVTTSVCPALYIDVLDGKVNGAEPDFTQGQIKKILPCFTSLEAENGDSRCGGAIYYKDKDVSFYTGRDYVEIGPKFKGKLSIPLLGASRTGLFKWLGLPKIKDVNWDAFQTQYGILILYYKSGKVNKIQFSKKSTESIQLCQ